MATIPFVERYMLQRQLDAAAIRPGRVTLDERMYQHTLRDWIIPAISQGAHATANPTATIIVGPPGVVSTASLAHSLREGGSTLYAKADYGLHLSDIDLAYAHPEAPEPPALNYESVSADVARWVGDIAAYAADRRMSFTYASHAMEARAVLDAAGALKSAGYRIDLVAFAATPAEAERALFRAHIGAAGRAVDTSYALANEQSLIARSVANIRNLVRMFELRDMPSNVRVLDAQHRIVFDKDRPFDRPWTITHQASKLIDEHLQGPRSLRDHDAEVQGWRDVRAEADRVKSALETEAAAEPDSWVAAAISDVIASLKLLADYSISAEQEAQNALDSIVAKVTQPVLPLSM